MNVTSFNIVQARSFTRCLERNVRFFVPAKSQALAVLPPSATVRSWNMTGVCYVFDDVE